MAVLTMSDSRQTVFLLPLDLFLDIDVSGKALYYNCNGYKMASLTLRNLSPEFLSRARFFALSERRSLNSQLLVLLEDAVQERTEARYRTGELRIAPTVRISLWNDLCGSWKDTHPSTEKTATLESLRAVPFSAKG